MKEKIEEILLKHSPYVFFGNAVKTELFGETVKHLTTLINQEERKDAVRGFVDTIEWEKIDGVDDDDTIRGRNLVEQMETYLQSLDKGDTDENR